MTQEKSIVADLVERLNADLREAHEERAGLMEFDGGLDRDFAECLALLEVLRVQPLALAGLSVFRVGQGAYVLATDREQLAALGLRVIGAVDFSKVLRQFGGVVRISGVN